ncbi:MULTISPECIES: LysM peptidoglycan-binding domain-containing protein [Coprobacillaceae]|uniref:LysM peptidoglycan-binding domain-containing protein n=1 Tax=Coprobacillaceae TaxID=2810280 RepID=UPI000E51C0F8|nr:MULTISPECIES: LysM peptidoglycan-binding domain-containing protein [Coprobacillaceae]RHM62414.1 LysM domain-containing protein [Coprobacillus sp. AF33-1AC]RHS95645.1 LysM domain-containing protein [Erysipelatoclostridium sp. AM42-17]
MQKIIYEKWIDLSHRLKELKSLTVDESINYKIENAGVRALGQLMIKGDYLSDQEKTFVESVELDIMAPYDKIIDQQDFQLKVEDFQYTIDKGNILVKIEVGVHGVKQGEDRYIVDQNQETLDEIEALSRSIKEQETKEVLPQEAESVEDIKKEDEPVQTTYETKKRDEKKENHEDMGIYYLYVARDNDSYSQIATKYQVDEEMIRTYNQGVLPEPGQVIIVPYVITKDHS